MALYKRNGVWWYHFVYDGRHIQKSSKVRNKRDAADIEAAYRTMLAKGEVGIDGPKTPKRVPTFVQAMNDFLEWSKQEHAARASTHRRYQISSKALLRFFGNAVINSITSDDVEKLRFHAPNRASSHPEKDLRKPARQHNGNCVPRLSIVSWPVSSICLIGTRRQFQRIR